MQTVVLDKLLYADDLAENAKTETRIQGALDRMSQACDNFDLTKSTEITEVVHKPPPGKPYSDPTITVNGQNIMQTCPCDLYPLTPHFYIMKLGCIGVYMFFLFLLLNIDCWYSLEPPQ